MGVKVSKKGKYTTSGNSSLPNTRHSVEQSAWRATIVSPLTHRAKEYNVDMQRETCELVPGKLRRPTYKGMRRPHHVL
jgi:hypothetical protein